MILRWRGESFDRMALEAEARKAGLPLTWAAAHGGDWLAHDPEAFLRAMPVWMTDGRAVIVKVSGAIYVEELGHQPAGHHSKHGALAEPATWGGPYHAVVVVDFSAESGFELLDPYYPVLGQPVRVPVEAMLAMYACEAVVMGR